MANTYTFTQTEFDTFVVNTECCSASLGAEYVQLAEIGDMTAKNKLYELKTLNFLIFCLKDLVLTSDCLTEAEINTISENINRLCCQCCGGGWSSSAG